MKKASRLPIFMLALALGVLAFGTSVTQAAGEPFWKLNGSKISFALEPFIQVTELETLPATKVKEVILLTKVGLSKVEILCTEMKLGFATRLIPTGTLEGRGHFSGCVTKLNGGAAASACKPHSPGAAEGLIETNLLNGRLVLHLAFEWIELIEVEGLAGVLAELRMGKEVGSECSIGSAFKITGKAFAKAGTTTELKEETVTKLFSEGPLSALLFGGNNATIDGSAKVALTSFHTGMKWSGFAD